MRSSVPPSANERESANLVGTRSHEERTTESARLSAALVRADRLLARHVERVRADNPAFIHNGAVDRLLDRIQREPTGALPAGDDLPAPFARAVRAFGLSRFELDVLLLALGPELDNQRGEVFAHIPGNLGVVRPTVGLILDALCDTPIHRAQALDRLLAHGPLRRYHLLAVDGTGPFASHSVRVPADVWPRLAGLTEDGGPMPIRPARPGAIEALVLSPALAARMRALGARLAERRPGREPLVIVRGPTGSGRDTLASALVADAGLAAATVDVNALIDPIERSVLRREVRWFDAAVIVRQSEPTDGKNHSRIAAAARALAELERPVVWVAETRAEELLSLAAHDVVELVVERPDMAARAALWRHFLAPALHASDLDLGRFASRYRFGPGRIETAVSLARAHSLAVDAGDNDATLVDTATIDTATLEGVCRTIPEVHFGHRAHKLARPYGRDDLVIPPDIRADLDMAVAWGQQRYRVLHEWQMGARIHTGSGLTCLFAGPPGTGKTMAAQVIARELGLDIYRIDLSQVVDKYIGETEKNLALLFEEADASNIVLFFDEADALFGKRTSVKDAHDRYANVETGFLLQRLEAHDGVVILATNLRRNMDEAFTRRLQIIVEFPMPEAADRLRLWQRHLPGPDHLAADLDLDLLANSFPLSGGEIKNAVLTAAFCAADEDSDLAMRHLVVGTWRELQKAGRLLDPGHFGPWADHVPPRRPRSR